MKRRGWVLMEVMAAMAIIAGLATVLAVAQVQHSTALARLAESRQAIHLAEARLARMQAGPGGAAGQPAAGEQPGDKVTMQRLPDAAPAKQAWVRISVELGRARESIVGLAPAAAIAPAAPPIPVEAPR